jgi:hypothetical protein
MYGEPAGNCGRHIDTRLSHVRAPTLAMSVHRHNELHRAYKKNLLGRGGSALRVTGGHSYGQPDHAERPVKIQ